MHEKAAWCLHASITSTPAFVRAATEDNAHLGSVVSGTQWLNNARLSLHYVPCPPQSSDGRRGGGGTGMGGSSGEDGGAWIVRFVV